MTIPIGELCSGCRAKVRAHNKEVLAARRVASGRVLIRRVPVKRTAEHIEALQVSGWSYPKIAAEAGCSKETIKRIMRLYRRGVRGARCWSTVEQGVRAIDGVTDELGEVVPMGTTSDDQGDELVLDRSVFAAPWREQARCRDTDAAIFFPRRGDHFAVKVAKRVCAGCPVKEECLQFAIETRALFGIWGGLSERQRRQLRAGMRVTPSA